MQVMGLELEVHGALGQGLSSDAVSPEKIDEP